MDVVSSMRTYLTSPIKTVEQGKQALIPFRNIVMPGYTVTQSRSLWYALLLYKFKAEQSVPESLWLLSREVIISTIRNGSIQEEVATRYILQFNEWKEQDYQSFINDVASLYFQLLELYDSMSRVQDEQAISVWRPMYTALLQKVHDAAKKIGFLSQMEEKVQELKKEKSVLVFHVMHEAFWDMIEQEIENKAYHMVLCQFEECKRILVDIADSPRLAHLFDHDTIVSKLEREEKDMDFVEQCISFLRLWDSESSNELYIRAQETLTMVHEREPSYSKWLRIMLETITVLAIELQTRKHLWTTLFRQLQ
jgi:hypothetical protein